MPSKINTRDLKVGMFVADLDRPWTDTPFLLQGFLIEDNEQIAALQEHCEFVIVDRARSTGKEFEAPPARPSPRARRPQKAAGPVRSHQGGRVPSRMIRRADGLAGSGALSASTKPLRAPVPPPDAAARGGGRLALLLGRLVGGRSAAAPPPVPAKAPPASEAPRRRRQEFPARSALFRLRSDHTDQVSVEPVSARSGI